MSRESAPSGCVWRGSRQVVKTKIKPALPFEGGPISLDLLPSHLPTRGRMISRDLE